MDANTAIRDTHHASRMGYEGIVAILLKDKRVDPSAENNDAICDAAAYGNSEVVELLLLGKPRPLPDAAPIRT